jgi:uncharacterized repeat protein (TIGR01451 family)
MTATNLMAQDARHRAVVDATGRPATMMAGDVVQYQLTFTNVRADSVHQIQFTDPLPAGLHYVPSSARVDRADVAIEFSVDSGRTYTAAPTVDVTVAGQTVHQPAPAWRYTNIRWSVRGWVPSHGHVTAAFNASLTDGVTQP